MHSVRKCLSLWPCTLMWDRWRDRERLSGTKLTSELFTQHKIDGYCVSCWCSNIRASLWLVVLGHVKSSRQTGPCFEVPALWSMQRMHKTKQVNNGAGARPVPPSRPRRTTLMIATEPAESECYILKQFRCGLHASCVLSLLAFQTTGGSNMLLSGSRMLFFDDT